MHWFVFSWPRSREYPPPEKQWQSFNFYRYGSETIVIVGNLLDVRFSTQMLKRNYHKMKSKNTRCFEVMQFYAIFLLCLHNAKAAREFLKHSFSVKGYVKNACLRESSLYDIHDFSCVLIIWSYNDIFFYCPTPLFSNQGIRDFTFSLIFAIYQ